MEKLPAIPTPAPQRWREFRIQILPIIIFTLTLAVIAYLWRNYVQPVSIIGQVETNSAVVISTQEGLITELPIGLYEPVVKDQPLGRMSVMDNAVLEAQLAAIATDLRLTKARIDMNKFQNMDSHARARLSLLTEQVALAIAQVRLKQAENELQRSTKLMQDKLITEGLPVSSGGNIDPGRFNYGYDVAVRDRDALQNEIRERQIITKQLEQDLKQMESAGGLGVTPIDPFIEADLKAKSDELRLLHQPVVFKAPIDGVVTLINKRPGEKAVRGDVILTVSSPNAARIVGYLRQPLGVVPTTNDSVVVRTRSAPRLAANAQIIKIGAQMEIINPILLSPDGKLMEFGLPFLIKVPAGMTNLVPGEIVDLSIQYARR